MHYFLCDNFQFKCTFEVRTDLGKRCCLTRKLALREETAMEVENGPFMASAQETYKENFQKVKRMTRMGASSLLRGVPNSLRAYEQFMEQDLPEEDEVAVNNESSSSKDSTTSFSIGKKLNKTIRDVKMSIGNFSQRLRKSTRRRYALTETASAVDITPTRRILGRTPTKLYSPFSFDTPVGKTPTRRTIAPATPRMSRKVSMPGPVRLYSPPDSEKVWQNKKNLKEAKNSPRNRQSFRF
ncbi:unnamed protein product [Allacma fusca]|uniref:Uncharacterized protein n=1 Tax=Allacma fusca TaxID=39272 RepID=A0A8J2JZT2_9HEXA|nr:unnamed protein product [Allacma fusca]